MTTQTQELDYKRYLQLILGRKRLFAAVALAVMTAAVLVSYSMPKIYEAKSTVFIEQNVVSELVRGIAITPSMEAKIRVLTVAMQSRSLLLQVIRDLDMDVLAKNEAELENLILALQKRTRITLDERRNLFVIAFQDKNPRIARDYVNTLVRRYIEQNVSAKRDESFGATQFLAEQIKTFKGRIDAAEEKVNDFRRERSLILATDEVTLRREITTGEDELSNLRIRRNELEAQRNILQNSDPLRERLAALQRRLDELLSSYTEQYPEVIKVKAEIEAIRQRMRERGVETYRSISDPQRFEQIQVELGALSRTIANLEGQIARNREMLREMPQVRSMLGELMAERDKERQIYEQLVGRYGQSQVSKQMELEDKSSTFRVIDPAIMPTSPVSPNRLRIMLMGIVAGIGGAFGLIFLLDLLNRSVKSVDEVKALGLPIMALIPKMRDELEMLKQKRGDLRLYAVAGGYFCFILSFLAVEFLGLGFVDRFVDSLHIAQHVSGAKDAIMGLIR
jgi:polysaccharide biosynthesis transport protein